MNFHSPPLGAFQRLIGGNSGPGHFNSRIASCLSLSVMLPQAPICSSVLWHPVQMPSLILQTLVHGLLVIGLAPVAALATASSALLVGHPPRLHSNPTRRIYYRKPSKPYL